MGQGLRHLPTQQIILQGDVHRLIRVRMRNAAKGVVWVLVAARTQFRINVVLVRHRHAVHEGVLLGGHLHAIYEKLLLLNLILL